jgi:hypothetical protein
MPRTVPAKVVPAATPEICQSPAAISASPAAIVSLLRADAAGEGGAGRADGEDGEAGQERLLAADAIGQAACG